MMSKEEAVVMEESAMRRGMRRLLSLVMLLCVVACEQRPVLHDLSQAQANEVVAALHGEGIAAEAERAKGGKARFSVAVPAGQYGDAVAVIAARRLPSEEKLTFRELVARQGFLPASRETEQLRLDRALGVELEDLLEKFPGIISAGVLVRLHTRDSGSKPTVSVVLRRVEGVTIDLNDVRGIVVRSVPGVTPDAIAVTEQIHVPERGGTTGVSRVDGAPVKVPLTSFLSFRIAAADYVGFALAVSGALLLVALLAAVSGYSWGRTSVPPTAVPPPEQLPAPGSFESRAVIPPREGGK